MLNFGLAVLMTFTVACCSGPAIYAEAGEATPPSPRLFDDVVRPYLDEHKPTALVILQDGKIVASEGDVTRKVNVASVRKSLLSALFGIAVAQGKIDIDRTLDSLGIDDKAPALSPEEKRATVRDLLMARSGVYHRAAYETADIKTKRPERGAHAPGAFWFYNNWDFNALGTIYRNATGEDIFESFANRIAAPIGMTDFNAANDGRYVYEASSIHPAYPFQLTARDAARFGQLFLDHGKWNGKQIVPQDWIDVSTRGLSRTNRGDRGYGYMWWQLSSEPWGKDGAYAAGFAGQFIAFVPSKRLVIAQIVDRRENKQGIRTRDFLGFVKDLTGTAP